MSGFLLDTNVVSEMTKSRPSPLVIAFLARTADLWLASLVVHELEFGLRLAPPGRRRDRLRADLSRFLTDYEDRILPIDRAGAVWAARFRAHAVRSGRPPDIIDILIAGTARAHSLAVATRNVRDFEGLGVEVVNPWEPG
jgi:predicted nucleic acid-binding protein